MNDIKKLAVLSIGFFCLTLLVSIGAMAQDAGDLVNYGVNLFSSLKGAAPLVIIAGVVQFLIKLLNSQFFGKFFSSFNGFGKLMLISGLTIASSVIGLMLQGSSLISALMNGVVISAVMVYVNQIIQHYKEASPAKPESK